MASVLLKGMVVLVLAFRGHVTRYRHLGVQVSGIYSHLIVRIWVPLYLTIYGAPRIA